MSLGSKNTINKGTSKLVPVDSKTFNYVKQSLIFQKFKPTILIHHRDITFSDTSSLNSNKTCLKRPLKNSLMKVKSIAECSLGAFCNTFDLH